MLLIPNCVFFRCNDLLKNRDDSPSFLVTRLTSIRVLGTMYERLGRMTGRSYEETVQVLNKGLKNAESQTRAETMIAFGENKIHTKLLILIMTLQSSTVKLLKNTQRLLH